MYNPLKPGSAVPDDDEEDDDSVEIDSDVQRKFWYLVVVFNLAVLAASLGLLFLYFRGQLLLGGGLAAVGFAGLAYGFYTYWRVQREFAEEDARADAEANDESDE